MKRDEHTPVLSAIFVDYDNIYMSLKRKSDEAAKRFAKLSQDWLKGIETGSLITATNGVLGTAKRRIVMNRCYGNPVPRRNNHDNSTDMNSFPFIRHHFLKAGCEVVDCPPLTAQLKNSSDIRMVMDVRLSYTRNLFRRVRHPVGRCGFYAGAATAAAACAPYGDLLQRIYGAALYGDLRR